MHVPAIHGCGERARARPGRLLHRLLAGAVPWLFALACLLTGGPARAGSELTNFELTRSEDALLLDYTVSIDLPRGAEEALNKSVPLYFVAEAEVFRDRWYWRDKRVASATRTWRIVYQPLTQSYRVTLGGLSQNYGSRGEAFAAIRRGASWKIAEAGQIEEGERHYIEFSFRLDTSLLPRPMQIGIGNGPDWALAIERFQRFD
jgi:Domain of unknown function (DUF4390)